MFNVEFILHPVCKRFWQMMTQMQQNKFHARCSQCVHTSLMQSALSQREWKHLLSQVWTKTLLFSARTVFCNVFHSFRHLDSSLPSRTRNRFKKHICIHTLYSQFTLIYSLTVIDRGQRVHHPSHLDNTANFATSAPGQR